ncbi:hypothetical protein OB955_13750 [Halobacteria archaeon AArc-m2/3/4]|uniref:Uncharacterized protein n=1 Tax=Natronoglomus mannanivorans TaxID=2979990 RepID=A0AAP2Z0I0_9EURY|nr:hypothetical protein [Halobacteria archaeon AArc-xg1-1]MCU4973797.1 hypothetical protein [Halobacteria archaeon AArc-m2/3/4]
MSERFWEVMCSVIPLWGILFGLNVVLLVFVGLSLFLTSPEPGTSQIMVINVVLITGFLVTLGYTIRRCRSGEF